MGWTISVTATAKKQLAKLDRPTADLITRFLRDKIANAADARQFGHALVGDLKGRWRYRVGDYRVLCELRDRELLVLVVAVGHRREIYR
ncbi:MAG: type II toxin-antitoxin system RelE/ParE family toxin [Acidobacteriaceae bacterium]